MAKNQGSTRTYFSYDIGTVEGEHELFKLFMQNISNLKPAQQEHHFHRILSVGRHYGYEQFKLNLASDIISAVKEGKITPSILGKESVK